MVDSEYIGKGEKSAQKILGQLFPNAPIVAQCSISSLVPNSFEELGSELCKHKFDLIIGKFPILVVEVNLKHGSLAHKKWKVYKTHLEEAGYEVMTIDDNECNHLFESDPDNLTWTDYEDVIAALQLAGIKPK